MTPETLTKIGDLFLMGKSLREIGRQLRIDHKTVKLHLEETVKPMWEGSIRRKAGEFLAEVRLLKRISWESLVASNLPNRGALKKRRATSTSDNATERSSINWIKTVQWCLEMEREVLNISVSPQPQSQYRAAGRSPRETTMMMAERLAKILNERANR